ncbi:MAG: tape measure protein, partial [Monoglobus pectinilyticus]
ELQKYLTAVADAAAVAGTDMESMGAIFNKVATQGKANNEVLQQLAEKGIPIYQYLADETGKTAEEIFELASNGEIDLATFQKAVETHISGAAVAMGDATLSGAIDNLMASISRIGANFLGASDDATTFGGQIRELLIELRKNVLEPLEEKAAELGKIFGAWFAETVEKAKSFISSFKQMNEATDGALGKFVAFGSGALVALGPILKIVGGIVTSLDSGLLSTLGKLFPGFTKLLGPIGLVAGAILLMWQNSETFRNGIISVIAAILPIIENLFSAIMTMIDALMPVISSIAEVVGNVVGVILEILSPVISFIGNTVASLIEEISGAISKIADIFSKVFGGIVDFIAGVFTGDWERAWEGIKNIFSGIWEGLVAIVKAPINAIIGLINGVIGGINKISIEIPEWSPFAAGETLGFNIQKIPYLAKGVDDFQGGFAYINEGGRGELVTLPNGAQVIPHDISMKYARESARANTNAIVDVEGIFEGIAINVYSQTNVDGTPLLQKAADYTVRYITNQQRSNMRAKGRTP